MEIFKTNKTMNSPLYNNVLLSEGCNIKQFKKAMDMVKNGTEVKTIDFAECEVWRLKKIDDEKDVVIFDHIPSMDTDDVMKIFSGITEERVPMDTFRKAGAEEMLRQIEKPECSTKTVFVRYDEKNAWKQEMYFFSSMAQQSWNDSMPAAEIQSSVLRDMYIANYFARNDGESGRNATTLSLLTRRTPGSSIYRVSNIWKIGKNRQFDYDGLCDTLNALNSIGHMHFATGFEIENGYSSLSICYDEDSENDTYPVYGLVFSDAYVRSITFQQGYSTPDADDITWVSSKKLDSVNNFYNVVTDGRCVKTA